MNEPMSSDGIREIEENEEGLWMLGADLPDRLTAVLHTVEVARRMTDEGYEVVTYALEYEFPEFPDRDALYFGITPLGDLTLGFPCPTCGLTDTSCRESKDWHGKGSFDCLSCGATGADDGSIPRNGGHRDGH